MGFRGSGSSALGLASLFKGAYSAGTTYRAGEVVTAAGSTYISVAEGNVGNSLTDTTKWQLLAQAGVSPPFARDTLANRPSAATAGAGAMFYAIDVGWLFMSDGAYWQATVLNRTAAHANGVGWWEAFERGLSRDNLAQPASGTEVQTTVDIPERSSIAVLSYWSGTTGYTPGTGTPQAFLTLRKPDGTLVATTDDIHTSLATSSNARLSGSIAFDATGAALASYTTGESGKWIVGIVFIDGTGTTRPSLNGISAVNSIDGQPVSPMRRLAGTGGTAITGLADLRTRFAAAANIATIATRPYAAASSS